MTAITPAILPAIRPAIRSVFAPGGGKAFDPATLNQSAWYSRRDISTLWQDSVGTLAESAPGQPIGLGLDIGLGKTRGPELAPASIDGAAIGGPTITQYQLVTGLTLGRTYEVVFDVVGYAGSASVGITGGTQAFSMQVGAAGQISGNGRVRFIAQAAATSQTVFTRSTNTANFRNISVREIPGNHQLQATTTARPIYQTGPGRAVFDGLDDVLVTTFPTALGANCTVARAIPGVGAQILTGQNIGTTFNDNVTAVELLIFNRALTAGETASLTAYLNRVSQ